MNQTTIKFGLNPIMSPALLTERRQFHQGGNFDMKHGKICPTRTRVKVSLLVGVLRCAEVVSRLCQINMPSHALHLPCFLAGGRPNHDAPSSRLFSKPILMMQATKNRASYHTQAI